MIGQSYSYTDAETFCAANAMQMFDSNVQTDPTLINYAKGNELNGYSYVLRSSGDCTAVYVDYFNSDDAYYTDRDCGFPSERFFCEYILARKIFHFSNYERITKFF